MENQLTSLMKQKYGMTKSSPLVFTEKDTLYTSFRKLADNIYKNGEWSPEDERAAVDTMIRNQQGLPVGQETLTWRSKNTEEPQPLTITIQELSEKEKNFFEARIDSNRSGYKAITTKYDETSGAEEVKENFIFLDPTNKTGTKHNLRYYYNAGADIYWDGDRVDTRTFFAEGNMNRGIGYDKLQRDILKVYDSRSEELSEEGLSRTDLERLLRDLTNPKYSGKKWSSTFRKHEYGELTDEFLETLPRDESVQYWQIPPSKEQIEEGWYDNFNWRDISTAPNDSNKLNLDRAPYILESADGLSRRFLYPNRIKDYRKHNRAVDFIENYIQDTYDVFLQREYEKDIEKQVRASAWQTKKNINKETQELMDHTSLNDHFGFIEVDNDVDLALFDQFEKEMNRISSLLPKTQSTADLRLRKLGNYHALGIYHPITQTIAIDFRDYEDSIEGIGIQSFVHEYGHFLDYTSEEKMLSLQEDFQPMVARYRSNLTKLPSDSIVRNKAAYYGTPTEVWARAFEIYVSNAGLKSIFLKSTDDYKIQDAYLAFDETMRNELSAYFDQRFPELKKSIEIMNEHTINEVKERTEVEEEQSQAEVSSEEYEIESEESDTEEKVEETTTSIDKQKNEQLEKWNSLPRDLQNEIAVIYGVNPVNFQLALEKYGLEDVYNVFTGLDSVVHNEWIRRYTEELAALVKPFNEERKEWLNHYGDGKTMYIPESLWETAQKVGMMENYPKVEPNTEEIFDVANEEQDAIPQVNEEQDSGIENTPVDENDNSRLAQAKRKLDRLEQEFNGKIDQVYAHQRLTNGQPMNDKRNGQAWFNRKEQLENSARNLSKEIEVQKERVATLEWAAEIKAMGMNKQGGLIMSVDNIPRIKAEIESARVGESRYSRETILKYEKQLKLLEVEKEQSEIAEKNLSNHAKTLIESGEITQWSKKPTIYFVKGLRKVALELTKEGEFKQSDKYFPQTDKEKKRVEELLLDSEKEKEKTIMNLDENEELLKKQVEPTENDILELNELNLQQTTEQDQSKENSTGEQNLENSLFSENESAENRYFQVEFNESNPDIGINRYQGEIVTPELISEFQSLESLAADESKSFKFYFDEVVDGDVVKHHRMDLGDQEGINKPMYGLLSEGAVSKRRAMQIRPNRVVVGGRTAQRQTTMSVDDQQIDRYFRVESNEMDQRVFSTDYSGKVVTKDFITEMYKLEGKATYPEAPSEFVFAEVTNGEVTDHAKIEVGRNFAENKLIYDRLSEAAVSQEKAKELENVQPIQHSSSELKETVAINPDFNKIMQASSSEYLSDFKLALDEVFDVMEEKEEGTNQYLTRAEIDSLLDEHLTKIEKMISSYTTAAAALENATKEQKSTFLQEMLKNIKAEVTQFKENLLRTLTTKKDNVIYNVQDKTDTLRINVKNSINSRILKVNDSIKKVVEKVDQTFVLEEKELRSKIDSKTTEEQVKETKEQSVETIESPLEEKIELPKEKEEATQTPLENEHTVETKEVDQTPTSKVDEEKKIEQSVEPAAEASIEQVDSIHDNNQENQKIVDNGSEKNNYAQQIEQLSKQLNLTITDEDRKAIEGLSTEEKEGLIQELTTTISESSKSVSTEEPELEVG